MNPFSSNFHWFVIHWYWSCDLPASAGRRQTWRVAIRRNMEQWAGRRLLLLLLCSPQVRCLTLHSLQRQERAVGDERSTFHGVSSKVFWGTNLGLRIVSRRQQWWVEKPGYLVQQCSIGPVRWTQHELTRVGWWFAQPVQPWHLSAPRADSNSQYEPAAPRLESCVLGPSWPERGGGRVRVGAGPITDNSAARPTTVWFWSWQRATASSTVNTSKSALGAVMLQDEKLVAYTSKSLKSTEENCE